MEKIILLIIGLLAAGYLVRLFWRQTHGKLPCCCSSGCSSTACKGCNKEESK